MSKEAPASKEGIPVNFVYPDIEKERGELDRVADHFQLDKADFYTEFVKRATETVPTALDDQTWSTLDNTDSWSAIVKGDWDAVMDQALHNNRTDWVDLRQKIETGKEVDAPIIVRRNDYLHLVSGNTRLMIARALGVIPQVLIVDMSDSSVS